MSHDARRGSQEHVGVEPPQRCLQLRQRAGQLVRGDQRVEDVVVLRRRRAARGDEHIGAWLREGWEGVLERLLVRGFVGLLFAWVFCRLFKL